MVYCYSLWRRDGGAFGSAIRPKRSADTEAVRTSKFCELECHTESKLELIVTNINTVGGL